MRITYNQETMGFMNIFDRTMQVRPKDCFVDSNNLLHFVVQEHDIGRAIGKQGIKVKILERALKRKIKILPFNPEIVEFIKSLISPLIAESIIIQGDECIIKVADRQTRGKLIGRNGTHLQFIENVVKRYFNLQKISIA